MGRIVRDWDELKAELDALRGRVGKAPFRVVFTNGCFDLLHVGHIRYLRDARALGDVLVVGLNSDSSVRTIKPGRPIVAEDDRAEVLAGLASVDYVTLFYEDTPYELIRRLGPDILVKGGDWRVEEIVGSDIVPKTVSLPYSEGCSTTSLIDKIRSLPRP